ncbi:hypothetical protein LLG96_02460 [bacterium]|nr:hypothetical protein [bacterium]
MKIHMNTPGSALVAAFVLLMAVVVSGVYAEETGNYSAPRNFIFFNREHERISETSFLENESIDGAQLKYTWRELEPERDKYELRPLLADLAFLEQHGRRLFLQLQDVSFDETVTVPDYLRDDPAFGGGAARKYEFGGDDESRPIFDGWVARRWDPAVRARFIRLLQVLGRELDGRIEGLNLPETAIGFGESGRFHPEGFTYESYVEGIKAIMTAARQAFPKSCVIQYANFMPGEWLPWTDHGYLRAVYEHAERIGVGVGGPDLLPYRKGQQNHSYPLIAARGPKIMAGIAVQDGNLEDKNPATGKRVTVDELYLYAKDRLRLDYIFWGTQEPYYSNEVLPYIRGLKPGQVR